MLARLGSYVRQHHVGLIAIFIALGGSAYAANSVRSGDIADGEIKNQDLANDSIGSAKIRPGGVTNSDLAPDSVDSSKVVDSSLKGIDVLDGSLTGGDIAPESITGDLFATATVGARELGPLSVGGGELQPQSVTSSELRANSVAGSEIASDAVGSSEIGAAAVGTSEQARVPSARIGRTSNQGIAAGTPTKVGFNQEIYDPENMRTSSDINALHIAVAGRYLVTGDVVLGGGSPGVRSWTLTRNNASISMSIGQNDPGGSSLATLHSFAAGDTVGLTVSCANACQVASLPDISPILAVQWLGPN